MMLVCNRLIDGFFETQKALLDKMEGCLNHTLSEEFQKEYSKWSVILRVSVSEEPDQSILDLLMPGAGESWKIGAVQMRPAGRG